MVSTINFSYVFEIEKDFVVDDTQKWVEEYWLTIVLSISTIYIFVVYAGQNYMKDRPPFELRSALAIWNFFLAIFSICGCTRAIPEFIKCFNNYGLKGTVCRNNFIYESPMKLWCWMYTLSKIVQLGDTIFIILRKQPLFTLHWFHHTTAMVGVWYSYAYRFSLGRWTMIMNFIDHSLIYSYFFLRAMQIKIPRLIGCGITVVQILQMIVGVMAAAWSMIIILFEGSCQVTWTNAIICFSVYTLNFVIFSNFFMKNYLTPTTKRKQH